MIDSDDIIRSYQAFVRSLRSEICGDNGEDGPIVSIRNLKSFNNLGEEDEE